MVFPSPAYKVFEDVSLDGVSIDGDYFSGACTSTWALFGQSSSEPAATRCFNKSSSSPRWAEFQSMKILLLVGNQHPMLGESGGARAVCW